MCRASTHPHFNSRPEVRTVQGVKPGDVTGVLVLVLVQVGLKLEGCLLLRHKPISIVNKKYFQRNVMFFRFVFNMNYLLQLCIFL